MNPAPTAESLEACYPADYAPHLAAVTQPAAIATDSRAPHFQHGTPELTTSETPWFLRYLPLKSVPGLRSLYYWLMDDRTQPIPATPTDCLIAATNLPVPPRALELGCSTGNYLAALHRRGWDVYGVELCAGPARVAREAGWNVHQGTLETAGLQDETFDLIAAWMVLEHVPEPVTTIQTIHQLLRADGTLLLGVPNVACWQRYLFGANWYCLDLPRHLQHFSPSILRKLLEQAGFEQIEIVHHRTLLGLVGSLGIVIRRWFPAVRPGGWMQRYPEQPRLLLQLLLSPLAIACSLIRQGEGLTVKAKKRAVRN
jgi:SAM-dependent methyltransferase